jgi:GDP-L-fucose synthase
VTGGAGFLGSSVVRELVKRGVEANDILIPRSKTMDLRRWENCVRAVERRDIVIHIAGKGGGIGFNQRSPGSLFYENAIMGIQMMEASRLNQVQKFVAIGTVCAYPKHTPTPFKEEDIWNGYPEETNAPYGLAKKMLLVQAQSYRVQYGLNAIYLLPVNLYGPGDSFDPGRSHVVPALIKKVMDAKTNNDNRVVVWGTGNASREFLYVKDAAEGILLATEHYDSPLPVNLGSGREITIRELVAKIASIIGYKGDIVWDPSKPDGQPRRSLDTSKARSEFGFIAKTDLDEGLRRTIEWYSKMSMQRAIPS